jgi:hypothetical protein
MNVGFWSLVAAVVVGHLIVFGVAGLAIWYSFTRGLWKPPPDGPKR